MNFLAFCEIIHNYAAMLHTMGLIVPTKPQKLHIAINRWIKRKKSTIFALKFYHICDILVKIILRY